MSAQASAEELFACLNRPINAVNIRRILNMLIRVHWSDDGNFGDLRDELKCLTYSDDPLVSKLTILPGYLFNEKTTTQYPAIIVNVGDMITEKDIINSFAGSSSDYGQTFFAVPTKTSVILSHVHSSADVALAMAESTATFLIGIREDFMKRLGLRAFDVKQISRIHALSGEKAPTRFFNVEVLAQLDFNMAVTVNLEGHRLKKYGQQMNPEPT